MRRRAVSLLVAVMCVALLPVSARAAGPWWRPVALQGTALRAVSATGSSIQVQTQAGAVLRSTDSGRTFTPASGAEPQPTAPVTSAGQTWAIAASGAVLHATGSGALQPDPAAPALGAGAHLLAAPAALPGAVVAVGTDNTVWRRAQDGTWQRSLLLLPAGFPHGVPSVTGVAAFTDPLSTSVYLSTDGYTVLASTDGGDDWIRAGPGLPSSVTGLAADNGTRSVYAATSDGLWVHVLQTLPAPPVYPDAALLWRWLGVALVSVAGAGLGVALLRVAMRPS